jgi:hypothetical protein
MLFTLEIYKQDKRTKAGERLVGKYDYERRDLAAMEREVKSLYPTYKTSDGYRFNIVETMVTKRNAISGREFQERYDTPYYCSPSSESYWSM